MKGKTVAGIMIVLLFASMLTVGFNVIPAKASALVWNSEGSFPTGHTPPEVLSGSTILVAAGAAWKYLDDGSNQGTTWREPAFNDAAWSAGPAELGYGDGDEATVVSYGPDPNNKYITTYFRHSFYVENASIFFSLTLRILRDDGAVVYLNGAERVRTNMPTGTITYATLASSSVGGTDEATFYASCVNPNLLVNGTNVLAVEIHQASGTSTDISFNLELIGLSSDPPILIHLTWQDETNTTMTVTWQTSTSMAGDTVLYDTISRNGVPALYGYSASGFNYTYSGASGYIHDVELSDLIPDTVYYFICGGETGGWSSERAFRTAPSVSSDVRFVVGGDSRTNITEREKISKAMAKFDPAFVMHSGDMVNDGRIQSEWDSWFTDVDSHWIGENNLTIPIIPAVGNHEEPQDAGSKYFVQFALPGNEKWYSYNWGPDIHIIILDTETNESEYGVQRDWLEKDLATHANYTWKFVLFHRPPFVSGAHSPDLWALTYWVPLFDKYHVNIVFNGHEHSYQRSHPLNWTASQTEPQDYSNGTMYIVSGGWGAPLHDPEPIWYMACQNKTYHFCLVDVFKNGTLHLQAKDNQGNMFDEVTIETTKVRIKINKPYPQTYKYGETMHIQIVLKNPLPEPQDVFFAWYAWIHSPYEMWIPLVVIPCTIPSDTDQTFDIYLPCLWGSPILASWIVVLLDPSAMSIISLDHVLWMYTGF